MQQLGSFSYVPALKTKDVNTAKTCLSALASGLLGTYPFFGRSTYFAASFQIKTDL